MRLDPLNNELLREAERMKALPQRSLPATVNLRWFYVHPVYEDHNGDDCSFDNAVSITFAVFDQHEMIVDRRHYLGSAIQRAEELNREFMDNDGKAEQPKGLSGYQEGAFLDGPFDGDGGGWAGDAGGST